MTQHLLNLKRKVEDRDAEIISGMMEVRFETASLKAVKEHAPITKLVKNNVDMILEKTPLP